MQIIAYSLVMFILFAIVLTWTMRQGKNFLQPRQIPNGISATGIILDFCKSGNRFSQPSGGLDDVYRMLITIQVTNENGDGWKTKTREFVHESQFSMYRIGDTLHIKYDPENLNDVVVDGDIHVRFRPQIRNTIV